MFSDVGQDYTEVMAQRVGVGGVSESTLVLCATIEEAAAPYADLDWLLTFPNVFEGHRARLIQYATIFGRAQTAVIAHYVVGMAVTGHSLDPYVLATREFSALLCEGEIGLAEYQWQVERLGRASIEAEVRRRGNGSDGRAPTESG